MLLRPADAIPSDVPPTLVSRRTRSATPDARIAYSGIAHVLGANPLLVPVLHAQDSSYSGDLAAEDEDEGDAAAGRGRGRPKAVLSGRQAGLVSALQTRGNARVGWIGSESMLRDAVWRVEGVDAAGQPWVAPRG